MTLSGEVVSADTRYVAVLALTSTGQERLARSEGRATGIGLGGLKG